MTVKFENREDMVGVLVRFQIQDERWESQDAESGRPEDCALETMRGFFLEHFSRRPRRAGEMIRQVVEEPLDS